METPLLKTLMGAYFHQDFDEVHGGMWETVDAFVHDAPAKAAPLASEIDTVLLRYPDDSDLEKFVVSLHCEYWAHDFEGGYRGWLEAVARRVRVFAAEQS